MEELISKKIENFFSGYKHQKYKKGEILIRADEDPVGVFFLKEGVVREYIITDKGEELVVNIFKPNSFFPMSWAINKTPNIYFFEAMETVETWRAPSDDVISFIKNNPDVLYNLMSRVYKGVDGILIRMVYLMSASARIRLIAELIVFTKRFAKEERDIKLPLSEKDLATLTGMTRETISREMKKLKNEGLVIKDKNKFIVNNIEKLEDLIREGY